MELIVYNITYWAKSELWGCDWAVPTAGFNSKSVTTTNQSGKRNSVLFDSYCDKWHVSSWVMMTKIWASLIKGHFTNMD